VVTQNVSIECTGSAAASLTQTLVMRAHFHASLRASCARSQKV